MEGETINMSKKSFKFLLVLVTIFSLISTFSFASDDELLTKSDDEAPIVLTADGEEVVTTGELDDDSLLPEGEDAGTSGNNLRKQL